MHVSEVQLNYTVAKMRNDRIRSKSKGSGSQSQDQGQTTSRPITHDCPLLLLFRILQSRQACEVPRNISLAFSTKSARGSSRLLYFGIRQGADNYCIEEVHDNLGRAGPELCRASQSSLGCGRRRSRQRTSLSTWVMQAVDKRRILSRSWEEP